MDSILSNVLYTAAEDASVEEKIGVDGDGTGW
jgi:hypothetical protein